MRFLHSMALAGHIRDKEKQGEMPVAKGGNASFLRTLLAGMGTKFKVIIQQKGIKDTVLSGMRFAQPVI